MRWKLGRHTLDLARGEIRGPDFVHTLTPREVDLLQYLVTRPGQVVSHDTLLLEVWGYSPRVSSRAPYHTIRRIRRFLEEDPRRPSFLKSVRGQGYLLELPPPEAAAGPKRHRGLPRVRSRFVGRLVEKDLLRDWLSDPTCPVVTVTGLGGVGKTSLAVEIVRSLGTERDVLFCPLTRTEVAGGAARLVAAALELHIKKDAVQSVADALAARGPTLIVLDNAEHLIEHGLAHDVSRWVEAAPAVQFLVTSHVPLELRGEARVVLDALPVPDVDATWETLTTNASIQLLFDRLRRMRQDFDLTPETGALLARCARRLGGWPLALELAAAQAHVFGLDDVLAQLGEETPLVDVPARQRSVHAALRGAWRRLDDHQQTALLRLQLARGGVAADDAATIAALDRPERTLADLCVRGWIRKDEGPPERYSMLEPVRAWLREQPTEAAIGRMFLDWAARLCHDAVMVLSDQKGNARTNRLERERDNLEAAFQMALERDELQTIASIALGLGSIGWLFGPQDVALAQVRQALERVPDDPMLWQRAGRLASNVESDDVAIAALERSVALAETVDIPDHAYVESLFNLAKLYSRTGQPERAGVLFERAAALAPRDTRVELAVVGTWCGHLAQQHDPRAVAMGLRAEELCHAFDETVVVPQVLGNLAFAHLELGQPIEARAAVERAMVALGDRPHAHRGVLTWLLGRSYRGTDPQRAIALFEEALSLAERAADQRTVQLASAALTELGR